MKEKIEEPIAAYDARIEKSRKDTERLDWMQSKHITALACFQPHTWMVGGMGKPRPDW